MFSSLQSLRFWRLRIACGLAAVVCLVGLSGCWVPFRSPGIPASTLPDEFRTPFRTSGPILNYAHLTQQQPADYVLGTDDVLTVLIPGLEDRTAIQTVRAQLMSDGMVKLPLVGSVEVGGLSLPAAQQKINEAYADGFLKEPVSVTLEEKGTVGVLVLGQVKQAGVHYLPRYQNDVGHAIAAAGGLTDEAAAIIEVHRKQIIPEETCDAPQENHVQKIRQVNLEDEAVERSLASRRLEQLATRSSDRTGESWQVPETRKLPTEHFSAKSVSNDSVQTQPNAKLSQTAGNQQVLEQVAQIGNCPSPNFRNSQDWLSMDDSTGSILRIPLYGPAAKTTVDENVILNAGDVIVIPPRKYEAFYVVGRLNQNNLVRFNTGDKQREIGIGFVLPRDREIDVVTAVVMAGYIDPIDSPTTVTLQRTMPDGEPLLIHVDLIKARFSSRETLLVQPGDIIYLNPDAPWWWRRTFDRLIPVLAAEPWRAAFGGYRIR